MPQIDLTRPGGGDPADVGSPDVVVVGTGPAGAGLVRELAGSGLRVVVLESGGLERDEATDRLDDIESVGRPRVSDQWAVRNRILGGSSHTWGGRCAPFDDIDYEQRSWVPASGWPIGPSDLTTYLDRSAEHLGLAVGTGFEDDRFWALSGRVPPTDVPDPDRLLPFFWQFSRDDRPTYPFEYTRFGRAYTDELHADTTLVLGATVTQILVDATGEVVSSVEYAAPDGRRHRISTRCVVLAAGGIENTRLMLASDETVPGGLGNQHGLVGRYLMDHPRGPVATIDGPSSTALLKRLGRYNVRGHLFRAGFRLSPALQREERLLNCAAWLGEVVAPDDPWDALRRFARGAPQLPGDVVSIATGAGLLVRGVRDYAIEKNGIPRRLARVDLLAMVEQRPDPDSRVTLSPRRDRFGSPLARVDWRVHPEESRTMRRTAEVVAEELVAMGFDAPQIAPWVLDGGELPEEFVDVAHPTGTTRMSEDPRDGVVDADGQVHGIAGLFVVGSSTFPTTGHCNPTQMIVAMAVRLADHLRARTRPGPILLAASEGSGGGEAAGELVLVTGATGRIGRVLVEDLLDRGYRVRATTSRPPASTSAGIGWVQVDLATATPTALDELVAGVDAVVHLAAEIGNQDAMTALNVAGTRLLAEAAERAACGVMVYTSTVSVYGSGRRRRMHEDAPTLTTVRDVPAEYLAMDYVRAYGRTKLLGERAVAEVAGRVPYVVLRPAVVVDEDQLIAIRDWDRTKRYLAAHRHAHHVYVRDVADVMIWALRRGLDGGITAGTVETYNVAEDERPGATHAAFLRRAHEASGDPRFKVPPVPGLLDWVHDLVRFRRLTLRNPLWRMRFPSARLRAAGHQPRYGMRRAEANALRMLRQDGTQPHCVPDASAAAS